MAQSKTLELIRTQSMIIETPERVFLEFQPASLGNRFIAAAIDHILQFFIIGLIFAIYQIFSDFTPGQRDSGRTVVSMQNWLTALLILGLFLVFVGYFTLFEWLWSGQTPGKRISKLRVIRDDGRAVTLWDVITRNFIRVFDAFPGFLIPVYSLGLISIFLSSRSQRVGDLFAGTVVVKEDSANINPYYFKSDDSSRKDAATIKLFPEVSFSGDSRKLNQSQIEIVESFLRRREALEESRRKWMAWRIAIPLMLRMQIKYKAENFTYEGFLESLVKRWRESENRANNH